MIEWFDFDGLGKAPSRIDFKKLESLNGHYIREAGDMRLYEAMRDWIVPGDALRTYEERKSWLVAAMPFLKERAKTLVDLYQSAAFLMADRPLARDAKAEKSLDGAGRDLLRKVRDRLEALETWDRETLENVVNGIAETCGLKFGQVAQPVRAALTGTTASPSIFDIFLILGLQESLARIGDCLSDPMP